MDFIMQTGLSHITNEMKTAQATQRTNASNISHFVIGFPVSSWWGASFGLLPVVFLTLLAILGEASASLNFQGSGGLSRFYIGNAFQLHKAISIGANINYLFGTLTTERGALLQITPSCMQGKTSKHQYQEYIMILVPCLSLKKRHGPMPVL